MSDHTAAPSGADATGASSSATTTTTTPASTTSTRSTKPASAGKPRAKDLTQALAAKRAENATTEQASPDVAAQPNAALGGDEAGKKPEGETAELQAGEGDDKPKEKAKDQDGELPGWVKERLGKEKTRREKLETDLTASRSDGAKLKHLFDVQQQEISRLTELLRTGAKFDERAEELQTLKAVTAAEKELAKIDERTKSALEKLRDDDRVSNIAEQLRSEVKAASAAFPLVSEDEIKAKLRSNARLDIQAFAKAKHEERMALVRGQAPAGGSVNQQTGAPSGAQATAPTTAAKPTGSSVALPPLNARGMSNAFSAARAKR